MPTVYGVNLSPFVRKLRCALLEKGIAHEVNPVVPFGVSDEFRKLSPLGKIPAFVDDDGFTIADSSVILSYLERTRPEPALFPEDPRDLARALFIEEVSDTALVDATTVAFGQRVIETKFFGRSCDEEAVAESIATRLPPVCDWLETQAPGEDADGAIGGRFGIADISVASPFVNFAHAGEQVDADRWPRLAAWVQRTLARPSMRELVDEEKL